MEGCWGTPREGQKDGAIGRRERANCCRGVRVGHVGHPPHTAWPPGPRLTRQLKCGPSSLEGETQRGMSAVPSATWASKWWES